MLNLESISFRPVLAVFALTLGLIGSAAAQAAEHPRPKKAIPVDAQAAGDQPDDPGPLATDLSAALKPEAIQTVIKKVADWQLRAAEPGFNRQWTFAALYDGLLAASKATGDAKYRDAVRRFAEQSGWQLIDTRFPHADDQAMGKAYTELYLADAKASRQPRQIANTKAMMDRLTVRPDDPNKLLWWWCDALYMAPPVLARMYVITGDRKYLDTMDREWWLTSNSLYSRQFHLYFRDASYFGQKQANGLPIFWSRGNGWVMGGLAKTLEAMPKSYPARPKYIEQYKQMAGELASIQGKDGLWRAGLLDPDAYELPEISGTAFITYGIAWGINQRILDRKMYLPVVEKAWKGMLSHIYADGRLGAIQPIGAAPGEFKPSASYVYGVGGFLQAGYELNRLAGGNR